MNRRRSWALVLLAGLLLLAPPARADVAERRDESDCGARHFGTERGIGVLFLVIGAGAFAVSRRRRG